MELDQSYWDHRYKNQNTGWDIGYISTPLKTYFEQLEDPNIRILIPGAGNSYEAEYLHKKGFKNVTVLDISEKAIENFRSRVPTFPKKDIICQDFFTYIGTFDLIIEQTFFCALDTSLRQSYAKKMATLLHPKGKLVGLLFSFPLTENGPPFGGSQKEYETLFTKHFKIEVLEEAYNSILPRQGKELFLKLIK